MWHIRLPTSTPTNPQTMCGAAPESYTLEQSEHHAEIYSQFLGCEKEELMKSPEVLLMTQWEWVKQTPTLRSLCPECVSACQPMGPVRIAEIQKEINEEMQLPDEIPF